MARDSGLFGGIGGDDNSLVDNEFDYKKHSVKDLAQHFALVKPKAQLPTEVVQGGALFPVEHLLLWENLVGQLSLGLHKGKVLGEVLNRVLLVVELVVHQRVV